MRKVLAKVDNVRLGRAVTGLLTQALVFKDIQRREKEFCTLVLSHSIRGLFDYGICIKGR